MRNWSGLYSPRISPAHKVDRSLYLPWYFTDVRDTFFLLLCSQVKLDNSFVSFVMVIHKCKRLFFIIDWITVRSQHTNIALNKIPLLSVHKIIGYVTQKLLSSSLKTCSQHFERITQKHLLLKTGLQLLKLACMVAFQTCIEIKGAPLNCADAEGQFPFRTDSSQTCAFHVGLAPSRTKASLVRNEKCISSVLNSDWN